MAQLDNDAARQAQKSANVFREIMGTPDKAIPRGVIGGARCIGVFPAVFKGGFFVGGRYGRGTATCRTKLGWSAPIFLKLRGGSVGLQIGGQATDYIFLFMNQNGLRNLLNSKVQIGGEASAAAGPVGREAGAATDIKMGSQILSYSRSKGLFAGAEIKGVNFYLDQNNMRAAYGSRTEAERIIRGSRVTPEYLRIFPDTVARYAYRSSRSEGR
ncbi:MAG: lipid-binding SYLF domain-containing protein [Acidobacteria bacterium]|nr:lipid-binding SYLF domain-containing protein [Acidobacteriota bacterium]